MRKRFRTLYLLTAAVLGFQMAASPLAGSGTVLAMEDVPAEGSVTGGDLGEMDWTGNGEPEDKGELEGKGEQENSNILCTFPFIFHMYPLFKLQEVLKMYSFWQKANRYRLITPSVSIHSFSTLINTF